MAVIDTPQALAPRPVAAWGRAVAAVWGAADPTLLEMARRRTATLLGTKAPVTGAPELDPEVASAIDTWPTAPALDDRQRCALAFTEQFVIDVSGTTTEQRQSLVDALGAEVLGFVQGLYVLEASLRGTLALGRLLGQPAVDWVEVAATAGSGGLAEDGPDRSGLWAAVEEAMRAVAQLDHLDPVTTELVRLRGARQHACRLCQSRRSVEALALVDPDVLSDEPTASWRPQDRVAVEVVDAVVNQPAAIEDALVAQVRRFYEPTEIVEMVLDVMRNAANKIAVAFGADAPVVTEGVELFTVDETGEVVCLSPDAPTRDVVAKGTPTRATSPMGGR